MARPRKDTVQITLRVPTEWLEKAADLADKLEHSGRLSWGHTDGFRAAIVKGFEWFDTQPRKKSA